MGVPGRGAVAVQGDSSSPEGEGHIPAVVEGDGRSLEGEELRKMQQEEAHHMEHTAGSSLEKERKRERERERERERNLEGTILPSDKCIKLADFNIPFLLSKHCCQLVLTDSHQI